MQSKRSLYILVAWAVLAFAPAVFAGDVPSAPSFQPARRLFARLFPVATRRLRVPVEAVAGERTRAANRECAGCEARPGTEHLLADSPRLTDAWLARHTYQANGGSFGDNMAVADFWYDAVHRRLFTRSLVLHEVDDPADVRLGRAPGTYPNTVDVRSPLAPGTTVGHVGFVQWSGNGFGAYFAALQGAVRDERSGFLDLAAVTGAPGTTRTGSSYSAEDLIKHVRLHPSGQLEVGFETSPAARPDPLLLVRGSAHVEGALSVEGESRVEALAADRLSASRLSVAGSAVPYACAVRAAAGTARQARAACAPGQIAIGGGGACAAGELRASRPTAARETPDGWEVVCSRNGAHTAYAICCAQ